MSARILFLTEGPLIPSTRFRVEQFLPHFKKNGFQCVVRHAYGGWYNRFAQGSVGLAYKLVARSRRAFWTIVGGEFDIIFLQRTALPGTALPEQLRERFGRARLIFDIDDALYLGSNFTPDPMRARKFRHAVQLADAVIVGNSHLAARVAAPEKTWHIPTVVDVRRYVPKSRVASRGVVGWIGTASNFPSLRLALPQMVDTAEKHDALVRIVSNGRVEEYVGHPRVEQVSWSKEHELSLLQSFDVGVMPLLDSEATLGKCGFKMLQYMAVGSAPVASAVGANPEIVGDSRAAVMVPPNGDWREPIGQLLANSAERGALCARARRHVEENFAIESVLSRYLEIFERLGQPRSAVS